MEGEGLSVFELAVLAAGIITFSTIAYKSAFPKRKDEARSAGLNNLEETVLKANGKSNVPYSSIPRNLYQD